MVVVDAGVMIIARLATNLIAIKSSILKLPTSLQLSSNQICSPSRNCFFSSRPWSAHVDNYNPAFLRISTFYNNSEFMSVPKGIPCKELPPTSAISSPWSFGICPSGSLPSYFAMVAAPGVGTLGRTQSTPGHPAVITQYPCAYSLRRILLCQSGSSLPYKECALPSTYNVLLTQNLLNKVYATSLTTPSKNYQAWYRDARTFSSVYIPIFESFGLQAWARFWVIICAVVSGRDPRDWHPARPWPYNYNHHLFPAHKCEEYLALMFRYSWGSYIAWPQRTIRDVLYHFVRASLRSPPSSLFWRPSRFLRRHQLLSFLSTWNFSR